MATSRVLVRFRTRQAKPTLILPCLTYRAAAAEAATARPLSFFGFPSSTSDKRERNCVSFLFCFQRRIDIVIDCVWRVKGRLFETAPSSAFLVIEAFSRPYSNDSIRHPIAHPRRAHGADMSRRHDQSFADTSKRLGLRLWEWVSGPGRYLASKYGLRALHQLKRNLVPRRLISFPHLLVLIWMLIVLWGERWIFESKVADCAWSDWEKWVG